MSTAFSLQIFGVGNKLMKDAVLDLSTPGSRVIWPASIPAKVTDVSISGPFTVSPAPTPGNPLVTIGLANVPTGTVWMGPASGAQGPPTFRKIQASDLASIGGAFQPTSASLTQISAGTWPGDVSITTIGTITTGIWNGSVVGPVYGGTGISSYILGDTIYASAPNVLSKLAGNTTLVRQFLRQLGTGLVSAAPAWDTVTKTDVGLANVTNDAQVKRTEMGTALGVATLDAGGLLPVAQLPPLAIVDYLGTVGTQAAMLALVGQQGDWAIRSDLGTVWIITGANPTLLADWTQLAYPTAPVTSVFGRTSAVLAQVGDYSAYYDALGAAAAVTPTTLGLVIGTNTQAYSAKLGTFSALADAAGWLHSNGLGAYAWSTPSYTDVGAAPAFVSGTANWVWATPNGIAGVPSLRALVAADIPSLSYMAAIVSDSPLTGSGTSGSHLTFSTQNAAKVFAGPATGADAVPTFRALAATDIPALAYDAAGAAAAVTPTTLGLVIGTNVQAYNAKLGTFSALADAAGWLHSNGSAVYAWSTPSKSDVGLSAVENTALSTWAGTTNLITLGTVTTGVWHGTAIGDTYISSAAAWTGKQAAYANLTTIGALANGTGWLHDDGSGVFAYSTPTAANVGALSTALTSAHLLVGNVSNVATDTAVTGDVTISNAGVTAIGSNRVTLAMLATQANNTVLGNISGGAAVPSALTGANVRTICGLATTNDVSLNSLTVATAIMTGAPSGGTAAGWRFGVLASGQLQVDVNGVPYGVQIQGGNPTFATLAINDNGSIYGNLLFSNGSNNATNRWMRIGWDSTNHQFVFNDYWSGSNRMTISNTGNVAIISGSLTSSAGFGCNGKSAQVAYASGGLLAGVVAALVANGILSN